MVSDYLIMILSRKMSNCVLYTVLWHLQRNAQTFTNMHTYISLVEIRVHKLLLELFV